MAQTLVDVRIVDREGRTLPNDEVGEVVVRGDTVMSGYWRNPAATASEFRGGYWQVRDTSTNGTFLKYDGVGWAPLGTRVSKVLLMGLWGASPSDVWLTGSAGQILRYQRK